MTEHEYEEWFEQNLGNVESLDKLYNTDSPFVYAPKPLNRRKWIAMCVSSFVLCLFFSFYLGHIYEVTHCWVLSWFSNLLLNFSIGLVASILIMLYTNIHDKNVAFYADMLPIIEKRIISLREAYFSYTFKIQREYQKRNYQNSYDAWHVNSNTCFVILNYIRFLNATLPKQFVKELPGEKQLKDSENRILPLLNGKQNTF